MQSWRIDWLVIKISQRKSKVGGEERERGKGEKRKGGKRRGREREEMERKEGERRGSP